jgi:alkylated DNA repair dioxygenase AlkB
MAGAPDLAWQGSLFGGGEPAPDPSFVTLVRHELGDGAWVDHAPGWLTGSDELFARLTTEVGWGARQRWMYDRRVDEPRLTAWWSPTADEGVPEPVIAMGRVLGDHYGADFDSVGLNLYRTGADSVAWHGDRVARTVPDPLVAIVSLGSTRRFLLRPTSGGAARRFDPRGGDLLVMGGTSQRTWQHTVPKVAAAGPRISVTFRHSTPARDQSRPA